MSHWSEKWQKNKYPAVAAIIVITIFSSLFTVEYLNSRSPSGVPLFSLSPYSLNVSPQGIINASQGTALQLNFTFTSKVDTGQKSIPIKDLSLTYYNSTIAYSSWAYASNWATNSSLNSSQHRFFSYSFSLRQITLPPLGSDSTILTIKIAEDAPTGQYYFRVNFEGNSLSNYFPLCVAITPASSQP